MITLSFASAGWCFLYKQYMLGSGKFGRPPGAFEAMYGAAESATDPLWPKDDAYYCILAGNDGKGCYTISRDHQASAVYPERLFVWARDDNDEGMPRDKLIGFMKQMSFGGDPAWWKPCVIPRGWNRGKPTYDPALRAETNMGRCWWDICRWCAAAENSLGGENSKIPDGWEVEPTYASAPQIRNIYIEEDAQTSVAESEVPSWVD